MSKKLLQGMAAVFLCLLLCACGAQTPGTVLGESLEEETGEEVRADEEDEIPTSASEGPVAVYVCGQVVEPGVYELEAGARVQDAVRAAGGFSAEADPEYWNLAETVCDGQQIRIPTKEESASLIRQAESEALVQAESEAALVNLNTATKEELMTLSGIGEVKAEAIIAYRETNGFFTSIEEIMNVSGIKEAGFEKIRDQITV